MDPQAQINKDVAHSFLLKVSPKARLLVDLQACDSSEKLCKLITKLQEMSLAQQYNAADKYDDETKRAQIIAELSNSLRARMSEYDKECFDDFTVGNYYKIFIRFAKVEADTSSGEINLAWGDCKLTIRDEKMSFTFPERRNRQVCRDPVVPRIFSRPRIHESGRAFKASQSNETNQPKP